MTVAVKSTVRHEYARTSSVTLTEVELAYGHVPKTLCSIVNLMSCIDGRAKATKRDATSGSPVLEPKTVGVAAVSTERAPRPQRCCCQVRRNESGFMLTLQPTSTFEDILLPYSRRTLSMVLQCSVGVPSSDAKYCIKKVLSTRYAWTHQPWIATA